MRGKIIIVLVVLFILGASFILINNLTGRAVDNTEQIDNVETPTLSRHIFYHSPRVYPNISYSETCYPKSEVMGVLPGNVCCEGLEAIAIFDEEQEGCAPLTGIVLCSDCSNGLCEYGENNCNCPEDCNAPLERL